MKRKKINRFVKLWMVVNAIVFIIGGFSLVDFARAAPQVKFTKIVIHDPGTSRGYTKAWEWWAKEVEKQTNGELKFEHLWGGPLGGYAETLDNLKSGVYDMATVPPTYMPAKLPLWTVFEVPFITKSLWAYNMLIGDMKDVPVLKQEFDQWKVKVMVSSNASSFEIMSKKPVKNLADLKGLKIRSYGMLAEVLGHFGAKSSSIPAVEVYENMQRGVVDAANMPWPTVFVSWGIHELARYALLMEGFAYIPLPLCISMDTWNKITPKNQEIMTTLARQAIDKAVDFEKEESEKALNAIKGKGVEVNVLSPTERDQMVEVAKKVWDRWVEKQEKAGRSDARAVMDMTIKKAKEYEAKDPFK